MPGFHTGLGGLWDNRVPVFAVSSLAAWPRDCFGGVLH